MPCEITVAAKVAPQKDLLDMVLESGLTAVELYTSAEMLKDPDKLISLCKSFPFKYAVHVPNEPHNPKAVEKVAREIGAKVAVMHDIFWEDEWRASIEAFKGSPVKLCVENIRSSQDPIRFMKRYGLGRCVDLEHLEIECHGIYEEIFINMVKQASHIHMTGYELNSKLWHSHIHHNPSHCEYFLDMLVKTGYKGLVVSEAGCELQTLEEFKKLRTFFDNWLKSRN